MNNNRNKVKLTDQNRTYKGKEILKVISAVIGDSAKDNGYKVVLEDGSQEFIPAKHFEETT